MTSIVLRAASDTEIAAIFRTGADHIVGAVEGEPVIYVRFQTIDDRRWGMINMLASVPPSVVPRLFYALRRRLDEEREPIYALAQTAQSPRLLKLIGLEPTGEVSVGKDVWRWTPQH